MTDDSTGGVIRREVIRRDLRNEFRSYVAKRVETRCVVPVSLIHLWTLFADILDVNLCFCVLSVFICVHLWLSLIPCNGKVTMVSRKRSGARKYAYRGDPMVEPPPPELAAILGVTAVRDGLITALEEIQRHYGYLGQDQLRYAA
ncbi:MAG: hypothetical protein R2838_14100 [Caldilineaceae bacterium]